MCPINSMHCFLIRGFLKHINNHELIWCGEAQLKAGGGETSPFVLLIQRVLAIGCVYHLLWYIVFCLWMTVGDALWLSQCHFSYMWQNLKRFSHVKHQPAYLSVMKKQWEGVGGWSAYHFLLHSVMVNYDVRRMKRTFHVAISLISRHSLVKTKQGGKREKAWREMRLLIPLLSACIWALINLRYGAPCCLAEHLL